MQQPVTKVLLIQKASEFGAASGMPATFKGSPGFIDRFLERQVVWKLGVLVDDR